MQFEDVAAAVAVARRAFATWSVSTAQSRASCLDRVHSLILERAELFAQAISLEMGAAIDFARRAQVPSAAEHIRVARDNARSYAFVTQRGDMAIVREAIGVCGLITPWNWPLYQITAKVGPALAAGCTVVLKPSELSPLSALLFAEVVHDAGIPPGVFNLVNGNGPEVGAALAAHPDVDMISITGSTRAGVLVAQAAAPTVKRVAQELGGKSPNVILPDADLARAIPPGVAAAFRNVGQSCSAPTRMIVPRERLHEVERIALRGRIQHRRGRSALAADHARPGGESRAVQSRAGNDRHRNRRRRAAHLWRPRTAGGFVPRLLLPSDHLHRGASANADRAGGDLWAGACVDPLRQRGRGRGDRQRHCLWPWRPCARDTISARRALSPRGSVPGRCTSTIRPGAPMRPLADTSGLEMVANTE